MEYFDRIYNSVIFIEKVLKAPLSVEAVAREAGISMFHFLRLFHILVGETPGAYIRKRRLSEAAKELLDTDNRIIDIAFDYQFQSQEAFSRAFKKYFNVNPKELRRTRKFIYNFPKEKLTQSKLKHILQGVTMEPKFIEKPEIKLMGMVYYGDNKNWEIPELWKQFMPDMDNFENRKNSMNSYGLCFYSKEFTETGKFYYLAAVEVEDFSKMPITMVGKTIPAAKYAVFTHKGDLKDIRTTYEYIYATWMPKSGYENSFCYDFEFYDERIMEFQTGKRELPELDIYIPVVEKK